MAQHIYVFSVLHHTQYPAGYIVTDSWNGRGNQYIQLVKALFSKLSTFPQKVRLGLNSDLRVGRHMC